MRQLCGLVAFLLPAATASAPIRVSCLGDSITEGACAKETKGYPAVLQGLLGSKYAVTNFGNSGKTMLTNGLCGPPAAGNCSYVAQPTWPAALASTPDVVTIMFGTNDAKNFNWYGVQNSMADHYLLDYIKMIRRLKQLKPTPKVLIMSLVPLYEPFPYDMNDTVINTVLAGPGGLLFQLAELEADGIIDIHQAFVKDGRGKAITCDGCHPLDAGYELVAATMAPKIRALLGDNEAGMSLEQLRPFYGTREYEQMATRVNQVPSQDIETVV